MLSDLLFYFTSVENLQFAYELARRDRTERAGKQAGHPVPTATVVATIFLLTVALFTVPAARWVSTVGSAAPAGLRQFAPPWVLLAWLLRSS